MGFGSKVPVLSAAKLNAKKNSEGVRGLLLDLSKEFWAVCFVVDGADRVQSNLNQKVKRASAISNPNYTRVPITARPGVACSIDLCSK